MKPAWYTHTVEAVASGVISDAAADRLPVLADALEDAGFGADDSERDLANHERVLYNLRRSNLYGLASLLRLLVAAIEQEQFRRQTTPPPPAKEPQGHDGFWYWYSDAAFAGDTVHPRSNVPGPVFARLGDWNHQGPGYKAWRAEGDARRAYEVASGDNRDARSGCRWGLVVARHTNTLHVFPPEEPFRSLCGRPRGSGPLGNAVEDSPTLDPISGRVCVRCTRLFDRRRAGYRTSPDDALPDDDA